MLYILFTILMIGVFGKLLSFAFKMTWGIIKVLGILVLIPVILIALVCAGLFYIALPLLVFIWFITLITRKSTGQYA